MSPDGGELDVGNDVDMTTAGLPNKSGTVRVSFLCQSIYLGK